MRSVPAISAREVLQCACHFARLEYQQIYDHIGPNIGQALDAI